MLSIAPNLRPRGTVGWALDGRSISAMFVTLTGAWPSDPAQRDVEARVAAMLALQVEAGIQPLSDGQLRWTSLDDGVREPRSGPSLAEAWAATVGAAAASGGGVVKQAVPGPLSFARRAGISVSEALDILAPAVEELAVAGCAVIEVEEPDAVAVADDVGRAAFVAAHRRLLEAGGGMHATLTILGGSVHGLGPVALYAAPYHSFLLDLIGGPDNWRLIAAAPAERGIVCGALRIDGRGGDQAPLLAWAARYAAALNGRGTDRVGLANAAPLATLTPDDAAGHLRALGRAAHLAALPAGAAIEAGLDPRSFDARTAALGGLVPRAARGSRRRG